MLLTEANGNLAAKREKIISAIASAENYVFPKLGIDWDIDLLVTNRLYDILIPEDGVGGRTVASDFIEFTIDEGRATEELMSEMVVHELCHAARWGKNDEWATSLFDCIICEGIATYFEAEFAKEHDKKTVFIRSILERDDNENTRIFNKLQKRLDSNNYDYATVFFSSNDEFPRWSGYSLGYYLVKEYLRKTGKKIEEAFTDKYADYRVVLR